MRTVWALVCAGLALGGCQTAAQQQAREAQADDAACRVFGYRPGTVDYAQCRERRDAASRQEALAALGALQGIRSPQLAPPPTLAIPRSVTANCSTVGNMTNCVAQ